MRRTMLVIFVLLKIFVFINEASNGKFQLTLGNVNECQNPKPPFPKKRIVEITWNIYKVKGKTLISGKSTVLSEIPFKNLSASTFSVDEHGRQELKFHLERLTCRSIMAQSILIFADFRYSKTNCMLLKNVGSFKDIDVDKIAHSVPSWHSEGTLMHRVSLVHHGNTVMCYDIYVTINPV